MENSIEKQIMIMAPVDKVWKALTDFKQFGQWFKVKESGFNKITASRRAEAYKMHTGGWEAQLKNIETFLVKN